MLLYILCERDKNKVDWTIMVESWSLQYTRKYGNLMSKMIR